MAIATSTALGIAAATAAVGSTAQYFEQKKAGRRSERAQESANRTSQASAQIEAARSRRRAIAQQRIANARNEQSVGSEVIASSGLSGVQSSLSSQLGANVGAQNQQIGAQRTIQGYQQQSADAIRRGQERVGMWGAVTDVAKVGMSFVGTPSSANAWSRDTP